MPFCTTCGAEVQGSFCVKCGSPAAGAAPAASTPMAAAAPPAAVQKKKSSPLVWILVGVVALFVLVGVAVIGAGFFVVHKAKQAGLDPGLMEKNPALAVTKMLAAVNPDIEVVRVDERRGLITLREKSSGKVTTVDFEDVKRGRIRFQEEGKEAVTLEARGSGESGSFEVKSGGETVRFGGGSDVRIPSWVPSYPGAAVRGNYMRQAGESETGAFSFTTADAPRKVLDFYTEGLKSSGLRITSQLVQEAGDSPGGMIGAEDDTRKATVTVGADAGRTSVTVMFEFKK